MLRKIIKLIPAIFLTVNLQAEITQPNEYLEEVHNLFVMKSRNIDLSNVSKKEFIYFGTRKEMLKEYAELKKSIKEKGLDGALTGLSSASNALAKGFFKAAGENIGAGLGIGIVIGLLNPYVMELHRKDNGYILIYDIENDKGEKTRLNAFVIATVDEDREKIKKYLENKIEGELR